MKLRSTPATQTLALLGLVAACGTASTGAVSSGGTTSSQASSGAGGTSSHAATSSTTSSAAITTGVGAGGGTGTGGAACVGAPGTFYAQSAQKYGAPSPTPMCDYAGDVILVVNTADV